jgi:hypothetical protein
MSLVFQDNKRQVSVVEEEPPCGRPERSNSREAMTISCGVKEASTLRPREIEATALHETETCLFFVTENSWP